MSNEKKVAVIYHIFYEDTLHDIEDQLHSIRCFNPLLFFNISAEMPNQSEVREYLSLKFNKAVITVSSNKGKDIGAKLLLIQACIRLNVEPDWFIFMHDKKSYHALNASTWKKDLLAIIEPSNLEKIKSIIDNDTECGIIASQKYVTREIIKNGKFISTNSGILEKLLRDYNLPFRNFNYIAGTMFWAKAGSFLRFFKIHNPLEIRKTLESGNVLDNFSGTYTHSWERMFSWIPASDGLTIKTI